MNLLLTGGAGYIGSHVAVVLLQAGHRVVVYDDLSNSSVLVLEKIERIVGRSILFVKGDVRDTELLRNTLEFHEIETVIHFAGLKAVGESIDNPIDYFVSNVQGAVSLLQAMQRQRVKSLIFSSSATVYGRPNYLPVDEAHPTAAINPYGRSKLHVEEMLHDVASSDSEWGIICLRYFNPVGAHESGLIGDIPKEIPDNLMPFIAQVAAGQRSELSVFGDDYPTADGTGIRDYIHVMDLAEGHSASLDFLKKFTGWHAINLGVGKGYSVLELVRAFESVSGCKIPYRVVPRRAGDVAECYADPHKAAHLLKWVAHRMLSDMCSSAWRFQQSFVLDKRKR